MQYLQRNAQNSLCSDSSATGRCRLGTWDITGRRLRIRPGSKISSQRIERLFLSSREKEAEPSSASRHATRLLYSVSGTSRVRQLMAAFWSTKLAESTRRPIFGAAGAPRRAGAPSAARRSRPPRTRPRPAAAVSRRRAAGLLELRGAKHQRSREPKWQLQQASPRRGEGRIWPSGGLYIVYTRSCALRGGPSTIVYRLYTLYTLCIFPRAFVHIL